MSRHPSWASLGLILLALAAPAPASTAAADSPAVHAAQSPLHDPRIVNHRFHADEVVRVAGRQGVQASIAFADEEHIENVAIGDSAAWQVTPNKRANLLFVKPLLPRARTNMTVVTDRRTYFLDLVAGSAEAAIYVLRFTFPDEPRPAAARTAPQPQAMTEEEAAALTAKVQEPADPARLNFAWRPRGRSDLLPARVYDDGQSTYLGWAIGVPIPAIQIRNEAGVEGPVNFAVRDDVIVIEGVPGVIVLRSGRGSATLERGNPPRKAAALASASASASPAPVSDKGQ